MHVLPKKRILTFLFPLGLSCASEKFHEELVCPVCETVLPKDGTCEFTLRPDNQTIERVSEPGFGLEPKLLCQILQNGLEFWAQQRRNENLMQMKSHSRVHSELDEEKALNRKISMVSKLIILRLFCICKLTDLFFMCRRLWRTKE